MLSNKGRGKDRLLCRLLRGTKNRAHIDGQEAVDWRMAAQQNLLKKTIPMNLTVLLMNQTVPREANLEPATPRGEKKRVREVSVA
jgi:hypothetical protein